MRRNVAGWEVARVDVPRVGVSERGDRVCVELSNGLDRAGGACRTYPQERRFGQGRRASGSRQDGGGWHRPGLSQEKLPESRAKKGEICVVNRLGQGRGGKSARVGWG